MIKLSKLLKEVASNFKIYCDLDGVLVDFRRGYKDLTGKEPPPLNAKVDKREFWKAIDQAGASFWADLNWTKDGIALWTYIEPYNPEILSSPSNSFSSEEGKKMWMAKNLPNVKLNLEQSESKQVYAEPNSILIDDRPDICQRWNEAGGIAIHHVNTESTIKKLQELGIDRKENPIKEEVNNIENEIFSAYNGRYLFNVDKAYDLIKSGKVQTTIKSYSPEVMHFLSHPEFSASDKKKYSKFEIDYNKPIGIVVNFENPETGKTEWILIDGNNRTRKAVEDGKSAKYYVIQNIEDTKKFMSVDVEKPHNLFPDED
jgi:hypothetical protein